MRATGKRDKRWVCEWPPSGINTGLVDSRQAGQILGLWAVVKRDEYWVCEQLPSGINASFVFPPSGLRPPSRVPMKKMRAFFSWEPRPPQAGEGIFPCTIRDWVRARRDKHWTHTQDGLLPTGQVPTAFCVLCKNTAKWAG